MKTRFHIIVLLFFLSLSMSIQLVPCRAADKAQGTPLTLLFTHDLHSFFLPHPVLDDDGTVKMVGGYDRLATAIQDGKKTNPDGTLVLDAGDFSMGTLFQTQFRSEALELRLMGQMGYECTTIGNHEFDTDSKGLAEMLQTASSSEGPIPRIVSSNLGIKSGKEKQSGLKAEMDKFPIRDYTLFEKNGVKIGVFGLIGKEAAKNTVLGQDVDFKDPIIEARRVVALLRDKVDIIICLSHSGTNIDPKISEDQILASEVPEIDIIVSGHTHTVLPKPIISGKTIIVSDGCYGSYLGKLDIMYKPGERPTLADYQLIPMTPQIKDDPAVQTVIENDKKLVDQNFLADYHYTFDQQIAASSYNMASLQQVYSSSSEMGLGDMVADGYRYAVAQAEGPDYQYLNGAVQAQGEIRDSVVAGPVTINDIFRILSLGMGPDGSVGYPLCAVYLNGAEVKNCLEIHASVAALKNNNNYRLQVSGVEFKFNPNRPPFNRVYDVLISTPQGGYEPIEDDKLYRICLSYYSAAMLNKISDQTFGLVSVVPKDRDGKPVYNVDNCIIDWDRSQSGIQELKQWQALAMYMQSFPDTNNDGIPDIPKTYSQPAGRYVEVSSWNPLTFMYDANKITYGLVGLLFLIGLAIKFAIRAYRRSREGAAEKPADSE